MLVLPVYDLLLLPGVTFYFKKDILDRMQVEKVEKGEEILFLIHYLADKKTRISLSSFLLSVERTRMLLRLFL